MNIILTAMDAPLADAWRTHCGHLDAVSVHHGSIFDVACDAVVSPANSFGYMRGGIDALYAKRFGLIIEDRVRDAIAESHGSELPVGQALIVETGDPKIPWLISAPTMRTPTVLGPDTDHPRRAIGAALRLVKDGTPSGEPVSSKVATVAFPGMGTGVGGVPPEICAQQMCDAILAILS